MNERAVLVGDSRSMVGVVTEPPGRTTPSRCGVLLLNAGAIHRVGPNRLYVKLARRLAEAGFPVLRFDFSGIGDSVPRSNDIPLNDCAVVETQAAMSLLAQSKGVDRFILIGICSGADVALRAASQDSRVIGAVLINGTFVPTDSYDIYRTVILLSVLSDTRIWRRFFTGKIDYRSIPRFLKAQMAGLRARFGRGRPKDTLPDHWLSLGDRGVGVLIVYSEGDANLRIFQKVHEPRIRDLPAIKRPRIEIVPGADHTFTLLSNQNILISMIDEWARGLYASERSNFATQE